METRSYISNSNLRRILASIVLQLIVFYVLSRSLSACIDSFYYDLKGNPSNMRLNHVLKSNSKTFIFGASRALYHINAPMLSDMIGTSVTNAGSNGKNSTYQLAFLSLLLERHKPQFILYEVGDYYKHLEAGITDVFPYYGKNKEVKRLLIERDPYAGLKFSSPLYKYNQEILSIMKWRFAANSSEFVENPFLYGEISEGQKEFYLRRMATPSPYFIDKLAQNNFDDFIRICSQQNITLFLSYSPWYLGISDFDISFVHLIARKYNVPIWDFAKDTRFINDNTLFKDNAHLNATGAELYTRCIADSINKYFDRKGINVIK